jgi:hemolysin activation/secretion protein
LLFLFSPVLSFAQQPPPGEDIGAQAERMREEAKKRQLELLERKMKPWLEFQEEKEKQRIYKDVSFVLKGVQITGTTIFNPQDFQPLYLPYLDKRVSFRDLKVIMEQIKDEYKKRGYLAVSAYLPEQDISDGVLEIRIIEGKLGKLRIEGGSSLIKKFFHSQEGEVLDFKLLQRDLLRLNFNPDVQIKALISPGEKPQTIDVTLKAKDYFPHHLGTGADNQGTRAVGKYRWSFFYRSSNLSDKLDYLFLSSVFSSRSFGQGLSYSLPIGTYGTRLGIEYYFFKMKLGKEFKPLDITGKSNDYTAYINWELALKEDFRANLETGLNLKSLRKRQGETIITKEELRIPYFDFNFLWSDRNGNIGWNPRFSFGIPDFLDGSPRNNDLASRDGSERFFFKFENTLSRLQKMPFESHLVARLHLQAASHTLPSSQQLQLGGINSIRGYPEGDYLADTGGILNLEWFFPLYFIPDGFKVPFALIDLKQQLNPVVFMDIGGGKLKRVNDGERRDKFLLGIGAGFRVRLHDKVNFFVQWAQDLGDRPRSGAGSSEFNFIFQAQI